jgi:hypothetical protein
VVNIGTIFNYAEYESAYSVMANLRMFSPCSSWKELNKEVLGSAHYRLHPVLSAHISKIANFVNLSPEKLLKQGTGYVLYALTMNPTDRESLKKTMLLGSGERVGPLSKQTPSSLVLPKVLKYCPACVSELTSKYGIAKWLTIHQLYGVTHCEVHRIKLHFIKAGEGGVNREYILPQQGQEVALTSGTEKALYLSNFISRLFLTCQKEELWGTLSTHYHRWLDSKELLTLSGNLRFKRLSDELLSFWRPLFCDPYLRSLPMELCDFGYIPSLVHGRATMHYLKHVMLMAYLARDPNQFFYEKVENKFLQSSSTLKPKCYYTEQLILKQLNENLSMREVSKLSGKSMSYIRQLASRNNVIVETRTQFIDHQIQRGVWRKAFMGVHRHDIATNYTISVGAVESIIQSHAGLSQWRRHLRMVDDIRTHRKTLHNCILSNPTFTRNEIKKSCPSYMYLYRHDKEWLYQHLPNRDTAKFYAITDWSKRDEFLAIKLRYMQISANSISEVDRNLGGHCWLTHYAKKLPLTLIEAQKKLQDRH